MRARPGRKMSSNSNSENQPYSYSGLSSDCHYVAPNHSQDRNTWALGGGGVLFFFWFCLETIVFTIEV